MTTVADSTGRSQPKRRKSSQLSATATSSGPFGFSTGRVAIYQGQPSGVLWYKPIKVTDTPFLSKDLRTADQISLGATISEPSVNTALQVATAMHDFWLAGQSATTTTTAVTTTTLKKG